MRDTKDFTILVLPGVNGSGTGHFQTAWEEAFPEFKRVEQADWDHPVYADWSARLTAAVAQSVRPVVLLAHSLGTSLVVVVSGYDVVAAQTVHARRSYDHPDIRFGHRYADIIGTSEDGRIRIDYGRFHETLEG